MTENIKAMDFCSLQQKENASLQLPNNVGGLEMSTKESLQQVNEEFQDQNEIIALPTNTESSNMLQHRSEGVQNKPAQSENCSQLELPKLSSDELLILADSQLQNLKLNPLPIELYLPDDIGSLHIPGTPERDTNGNASFNAKVNSVCDALEFKTNSSGRFIAELFVELPLKEEYPDYYGIIQRPICINDIRKRQYDNASAMIEDVATMFKNARVYNTKGSTVYQDSLELQTEFARELQLLFPDEAKDLEQQLANSCPSDTKKEKQFRKSPPPQEQLNELGEDDTKVRASRFKHATWLKRKEDNFFVYGSGSETDMNSSDERPGAKRRKKEAASRKGKLVGGR